MNTFTLSTLKKKIVLVMTVAACSCLSASANSFATLAGSGDRVVLRQGETALVMAGAGTFTYAKEGRPCAYIRLSANRKVTLRETSHQAIPLVGPCVITMRCPDGFLGMRIVATGVRPVTEKQAVASVPPKKSAVNP